MAQDALSPALTMTVEQQVLWKVVRLSGELDVESRAGLDERLYRLIRDADQPRIGIDVSGLEFCDSSGIASLVRAWKAARARGGELLLVRPEAALARKLLVIGLNAVLTVVDDLPG